jgi:tetratricopeptide (TPR) repeat protein
VKEEWSRALQYKKPIVPLRVHRDADPPFRLSNRQYIDFSGDVPVGLDLLRSHLEWLRSPEGLLRLIDERLADAERDLRYASSDEEKRRIEAELEQLREDQRVRQRQLDDPAAAAKLVEDKIARGLEEEREASVAAHEVGTGQAVNRPPGTTPGYFQNRFVETRLVGTFLRDDSKRVLAVVGRAGVGKTVMVSRVLRALEGGQIPEDTAPMDVDGIVYLGLAAGRPISFGNMYADLSSLLQPEKREKLERIWTEHPNVQEQMLALTSAFESKRAVVLLDNFEDVLDVQEQDVADDELRHALHELLRLPEHGIKVIFTTRVAPRALGLGNPARYMRLDLDAGLESPYAENILREMDADGKVGLKSAPEQLLTEVRTRTLGYPRALEAFFAILSADRYTTLEEVLAKAEGYLPENVVESLVGEAFHRVDPTAQQVVQALAVVGRPERPAAVDYLLHPYEPAIDSEPVLRRLASMYLVRMDRERFWLHPVDSAYALNQIPPGSRSDWSLESGPVYSRSALLYRAAGYYAELRTPQGSWLSLEDLAPQFAEFELRVASDDDEGAFGVLGDIVDPLWTWGHYRQIIALCERVVGRIADEHRVAALAMMAKASHASGDSSRAVDLFRETLALAESVQASEAEPEWRSDLGWSLLDTGEYDEAVDEFNRAAGAAEDAGEIDTEVNALFGLGAAAEATGRHDAAEQMYSRALNLYVPALHSLLGEGDESEWPTAEEIVRDFPIMDPLAWHPVDLSAEMTDGGTDEVTTVVVPGYVITADEDLESGLPLAANDTLADIWMELAALYARTDRLGDAENCCKLAGQLYESLGSALGLSRALDLWQQIAASRADVQTREESMSYQEGLLADARASNDVRAQLKLLLDLGDAYLAADAIDRAESAFQEAERIASDTDNDLIDAIAENGLARIDWIRGEDEAALLRLERLEKHYLTTGMKSQLAEVLKTMGDIHLGRFQREKAAPCYLAALRAYLELGIPRGQIDAQIGLAAVASGGREYDEAVEWLLSARRIAETIGIRSLTATVLSTLASAYSLAGNRALALTTVEEAREIARSVELAGSEAHVLLAIGDISVELDHTDNAVSAYSRAREIYAGVDRRNEVRALSGLTYAYGQQDEYESALNAAQDAVAVAEPFGDRDEDLWDAKMHLGLALGDIGRYGEAIDLLAASVRERPGDPIRVGNLGWVLYQAGEYERSLEESRRALRMDPAQAWAIRNVGHALLALGHPDEARREYERAIKIQRGGEHFRETIKVVRRLLEQRPDLPGGAELLALLEDAQRHLTESSG